MSRRRRPAPPPDLSVESQAVWPGLAADLEAATGGSEVDLALLADLLRARDRLAQVRAVLALDGPTVAGSKGQTRAHPLIVTESVLRREIAAGFDALLLSPRHRGFLEVTAAGRLRPG